MIYYEKGYYLRLGFFVRKMQLSMLGIYVVTFTASLFTTESSL